MNSFNVIFQQFALIKRKYILICKWIDWFLRNQQVRGVPWSELFLKFKTSKDKQNFCKIFKNKELIFRDAVGLLPVTLLKKKHSLLNVLINSYYRLRSRCLTYKSCNLSFWQYNQPCFPSSYCLLFLDELFHGFHIYFLTKQFLSSSV